MKAIWEHIANLFAEKFDRMVFMFGIIIVLLSFCKFDGKSLYPAFPAEINIFLSVLGVILIIVSIIFYTTIEGVTRLNLNLFVKSGYECNLGKIRTVVKVINLEDFEIDNSSTSATVLPANTTFVDECKTDRKSAFGSFVLKYLPSKITELQSDIIDTLEDEKEVCTNGVYPIATTILLPPKYCNPSRLILTATTQIEHGKGILSSPIDISSCISKIFEKTAVMKIDTLVMPVLGSGHGGVELMDSLMTILISIKFLSNRYHHLKNVYICLSSESVKKIKNKLRILQTI